MGPRKRTRETPGSDSIDHSFSKRSARQTKARHQSTNGTLESNESRYVIAAKCNSDIAKLDSPLRGRSKTKTLHSAATDRAISAPFSRSAFHKAKKVLYPKTPGKKGPNDRRPAAKAGKVPPTHGYWLRSRRKAAKKKKRMLQEGIGDDSSGYEANIESEEDRAPPKEKVLQGRKIDRSKPQKELVRTNGVYDPKYYENIPNDDQ
ncbi:hypothetical protein F4678DRAFT_462468 [Xylaria arbuscula]|nr:hypothetical protein F4678DRAFT_462468 [Xylaria arbuscula]